MTPLQDKFKAIALCYWAWGILDHLDVSGDVGTLLFTFVEAFKNFDWARDEDIVTTEGRTHLALQQKALQRTPWDPRQRCCPGGACSDPGSGGHPDR